MDGSLPVGKGGNVPAKPLPKSIGTPGLDALPVAPGAVGYEVGANELVHRREVCTCEEVLKPALYDLLVLAGGDGDLTLRAGVSVSIVLWC